MKMIIVLAGLVSLLGCRSSSGVLEVGPGRYRVTAEDAYTVSSAEADIVAQANRFCAGRSQRADLRITQSLPSTGWNFATASGEFACVANQSSPAR